MNYRPFFSVSIIILTLLLFTIGKMEQRRMGYLTLKLSHQHRQLVAQQRQLQLKWVEATRPERVEQWAQAEHLKGGQVIAMVGGRVALKNSGRL